MKIKTIMMLTAIGATTLMYSCKNDHKTKAGENSSNFEVECDRFADLQVLRYEIPGFNELSSQQQELAYICMKLQIQAEISFTIKTTNIT